MAAAAADATIELPQHLAFKKHRPKPHIPAEYKLERPIAKPDSPDQNNPIVFYDVWCVALDGYRGRCVERSVGPGCAIPCMQPAQCIMEQCSSASPANTDRTLQFVVPLITHMHACMHACQCGLSPNK